jgi:hypothetical protein
MIPAIGSEAALLKIRHENVPLRLAAPPLIGGVAQPSARAAVVDIQIAATIESARNVIFPLHLTHEPPSAAMPHQLEDSAMTHQGGVKKDFPR